MHKVQRKWQNEIREAKTSNAKTMSWKGVKGKVTKGKSESHRETHLSNPTGQTSPSKLILICIISISPSRS